MCGIAGIWGGNNKEATARMVAALHHRGPDDTGFFTDRLVDLGMARLAVIDLNPTGRQPMANAEQTVWIVYNGETVNFAEQRALLEKQGQRFRSTSDTEVVLRLYELYGDDFLHRLRGMFALAIYDKRRGSGKERLLLARDHLGIKPLLYAEVSGKLAFASEIKALLASGLVDRQIDPVALRLLLTYGSVYQPRTMLRQVKMLMPAHRMIIENGRTRIERYWAMTRDRVAGLRSQPYPEQVRVLTETLAEAVRRHMVSDVPLGAFLSGGIDSSLQVAIMAREAGQRLKTFSVGFEAEGKGIDESGAGGEMARFLNTDHTHVLVRGEDVRDHILRIAAALDQPTVNGVNAYFISRAARQQMTVAVSGTGGDELFAGYPWFRHMAAEPERSHSFWARALAAAARYPVFNPLMPTRLGNRLFRARTASGFTSRYALQYRIFGSTGAAMLISPHWRRRARAGTAEAFDLASLDELRQGGSAIDRVTGLCLRGYTANQLLRDIDAASMAHSLEVRVPYLDTSLLDTALSLPDQAKLRPGAAAADHTCSYRDTGAKRILFDVGRPFLPKDFDLRPKRGFAMPFDHWLRGSLKEVLMSALSPASVKSRGWLDPGAVAGIKEQFLSGRIGWPQPWLLMMLELWAGQVLDHTGGTAI